MLPEWMFSTVKDTKLRDKLRSAAVVLAREPDPGLIMDFVETLFTEHSRLPVAFYGDAAPLNVFIELGLVNFRSADKLFWRMVMPEMRDAGLINKSTFSKAFRRRYQREYMRRRRGVVKTPGTVHAINTTSSADDTSALEAALSLLPDSGYVLTDKLEKYGAVPLTNDLSTEVLGKFIVALSPEQMNTLRFVLCWRYIGKTVGDLTTADWDHAIRLAETLTEKGGEYISRLDEAVRWVAVSNTAPEDRVRVVTAAASKFGVQPLDLQAILF